MRLRIYLALLLRHLDSNPLRHKGRPRLRRDSITLAAYFICTTAAGVTYLDHAFKTVVIAIHVKDTQNASNAIFVSKLQVSLHALFLTCTRNETHWNIRL